MYAFWQSLVALFVAIDFFGIFPIFLAFTHDLAPPHRRAIAQQSILTATGVGLVFLLTGRLVLDFLGVTVPDFQVAGGILLVVLSISDLLQGEKARRRPSGPLGIVPLGIPLIAGPAVITTLIVLRDLLGVLPVLLAFVINLGFLYLLLAISDKLYRWIGTGGSLALSKIMILLLSAFGVMFIREGVTAFLKM